MGVSRRAGEGASWFLLVDWGLASRLPAAGFLPGFSRDGECSLEARVLSISPSWHSLQAPGPPWVAPEGGNEFQPSVLRWIMGKKLYSVSWRNPVESFAFAPQRCSVNVIWWVMSGWWHHCGRSGQPCSKDHQLLEQCPCGQPTVMFPFVVRLCPLLTLFLEHTSMHPNECCQTMEWVASGTW